MTKLFFTKKHLIISGSIGFVFLVVALSSWFFLIASKRTEGNELAEQLTTLKQEVQSINEEVLLIGEEPDLLDSQAINSLPKIPNGLAIDDYSKELYEIDQELPITLLSMSFNDVGLFPVANGEEQEGANLLEKQLRYTVIAFDFLSETDEGVLEFVNQMDQLEQYLTIDSVEYRKREARGGEVSYSASVVARLHYLSFFETGRALE